MANRITIALAAAFITALAGCSDTTVGPVPRVPLAERHVLTAGSPAGTALSLPGDHGFNIHIKQSTQNQGPAGQARGISDATPAGTASALAEAANGGSANAEFKIGHRIDNNSGATQFMKVKIAFNLNSSLDASDLPAPATLAKADLVLMVVDSTKRIVSKTTIIQGNSDESTGEASTPQQRSLSVRLEPNESYDVVLYGTVQATSADNQNAAAKLNLDKLTMKFEFAPAATQPAAASTHGRPNHA